MTRQRELTLLGYSGLLPFLLGLILAWTAEAQTQTGLWMVLSYGAVIASYMAGMGAGGLLSSGKPASRPLLPGMIAALVAWGAILLPADVLPTGKAAFAARYGVLILVFLYLLWIDIAGVRAGAMPDWYRPLRIRLTAGACVSLAAAAAGVLHSCCAT